MSKVSGERYVYKFIDTEAVCQFNSDLVNASEQESVKRTSGHNNLTPFKSRPVKSSKLSSHRFQPYTHRHSANSTTPTTAGTTTTTTTTVVHHPITINQLSYEINSTNNFILNESAGLSLSTSYPSQTSMVKSADMSSNSSGYTSSATSSSYYQSDSPKLISTTEVNNNLATSTPNYYKYQTPVI